MSDSVAIEATAFRLLGEHLDADRVFYAKLDDAKELWTDRAASACVARPRQCWAHIQYRPTRGRCRSFSHGEAVVVKDAANSDVRIRLTTCRRWRPFRSARGIAVPLIKKEAAGADAWQ
jgi:hypothetical protein